MINKEEEELDILLIDYSINKFLNFAFSIFSIRWLQADIIIF
jgi:hypothetical protein